MIFGELEANGFTVSAEVKYTYSRRKMEDIYANAKNRDASQLNLISEKCYAEGLKMMEDRLKNYNQETFLMGFAVMKLTAVRGR